MHSLRGVATYDVRIIDKVRTLKSRTLQGDSHFRWLAIRDKYGKDRVGRIFLKLSPPLGQAWIKWLQRMWPAFLTGRSVKKMVDGDMSVSLPSLRDTTRRKR